MKRFIQQQINGERYLQDLEWGGPEHDDEHEPDDWTEYLLDQVYRAESENNRGYRERLVKIAALAVAAMESFDRTH